MKNIQVSIKIFSAIIVFVAMMLISTSAYSHCQIPCGIYDDAARVVQMLEDSDTVIKATTHIGQLNGKTNAQSDNQRVRWIMNKEKHAQNIIETISNYFLTQRVKISQKDYVDRLKKHHTVIVAAMKAKQSASSDIALALKKAIEHLKPFYPEDGH